MANVSKSCPTCGVAYPRTAENYHARKSGYLGLDSQCKKCVCADRRRYVAGKGRDVARNARYLKTYGITLDQYQAMFAAQVGLCAICEKPESRVNNKSRRVQPLCVDHCPITGRVRKLLCHSCNVGLGNFGDSAESLRRAAAYLDAEK